jgi:hypothetical protein
MQHVGISIQSHESGDKLVEWMVEKLIVEVHLNKYEKFQYIYMEKINS